MYTSVCIVGPTHPHAQNVKASHIEKPNSVTDFVLSYTYTYILYYIYYCAIHSKIVTPTKILTTIHPYTVATDLGGWQRRSDRCRRDDDCSIVQTTQSVYLFL